MDLPSHGRAVHLRVRVRRFRYAALGCPRRIFGEPLADSIAPRAARRAARLEGVVHHLGIALGGRPGASLARRLMLPVSRDMLLRVLRRRAPVVAGSVQVVGIDDFAWKRGLLIGIMRYPRRLQTDQWFSEPIGAATPRRMTCRPRPAADG